MRTYKHTHIPHTGLYTYVLLVSLSPLLQFVLCFRTTCPTFKPIPHLVHIHVATANLLIRYSCSRLDFVSVATTFFCLVLPPAANNNRHILQTGEHNLCISKLDVHHNLMISLGLQQAQYKQTNDWSCTRVHSELEKNATVHNRYLQLSRTRRKSPPLLVPLRSRATGFPPWTSQPVTISPSNT